ncbi:Rhodanese-related sulfurtransferase [Desulfacinum hydrothermale DSM 13146]|uniref:Rhodanese-related sulfurtransferase n=1 Tax=Desulfacinum hydrothermale DSM 13146 TaxID=1121390 RepID=A0A1W1X979_9BACT|nr:rhodanese-like domain-containing protein [Desulfacinum hydrothermale]SMC20370.1 Rhodanese-related sulfurtransferase [Desulfacinum hydrothermale DSM 13146]
MEKVLKGFTLDYFGSGKHKITPEKFFDMEEVVLLDVRSREESDSISIKLGHHSNVTSLNIPINEIPDRIAEIPKTKLIGVFCPAQVRSSIVYAYLLSEGFPEVRIIEGGYSALTEALKPGKVLKAIKSKK